MAPDERPVSAIGEHALIGRLRDFLSRPPEGEIWSGDDAAVVAAPPGRLVITTDVLVEGVDFTRNTFRPDDLGWKAMAVNVSDISAMGGVAHIAVVTLTLTKDITIVIFDDIARGLLEAGAEWGVSLVGGDISEGSELALSATVVGAASGRVVRRDGARVGDAICVTGSLGGAAGGLLALQRGIDAPDLIARQRRPHPPIAVGPVLADFGVTAMIDVSDGLAVDLGHIVEASGVGCEVDLDAVPVDPGLASLPDLDDRAVAVTGGEDFELLFTTDDVDGVRAALRGLGQITEIGVVTEGPALIGGRELNEWKERGWEHLRDR